MSIKQKIGLVELPVYYPWMISKPHKLWRGFAPVRGSDIPNQPTKSVATAVFRWIRMAVRRTFN
jgi:hypothetical protein